MNKPLNPLYKKFKTVLFYNTFYYGEKQPNNDLKDLEELKPVLFQAMPKKNISFFLLSCARQAYGLHYPDKEQAENLALYRAGLWYSLITGHKDPLTIGVALGVLDIIYQIAKMKSEFEIRDGNHSVLRCAYDDFLIEIKINLNLEQEKKQTKI